MSKAATSSADRRIDRRLWAAFFLLVELPLYVIAAVVCIRSGLFRFDDKALTDEQLKSLWTFIGVGLAACATILGALLTKSHNDRTLVLESDANERLKMDTVVSSLNLICNDGNYAPRAAIAGGLATLVQLGHPIIAMRALAAAVDDDGAVDMGTATWLIGQVLTATVTKGTPADLVDAKQQAASLLLTLASAKELTEPAKGFGEFNWPDAVTAQWPSGLSPNASGNLQYALIELLLSQSKEWWNGDITTSHAWVIATFNEAVLLGDERADLAASLAEVLLETIDDVWILGRLRSEIAKQLASADKQDLGGMLPERIRSWGKGESLVDHLNLSPTPVPNR
jgi:hypothetical protein